MLSNVLKIIMVLTSISPVFLTLWFIEFSKFWSFVDGIFWLVIAIVLFVLAYGILKISIKKLEIIDIKITFISTADKEVLSYVFTYILPLIGIDMKVLFFILLLFSFIVFTTHIYHFNPIFGLFGYHFYEVTSENGVNYVLMSKKQIRKVESVDKVILVCDYILIDKTNEA